MRIAIDIREACSERRQGKGQWTFGFVSELLRRDVRIAAYSDRPLPPSIPVTPGMLVHVFPDKGFRWHWKVARHVREAGEADLYVSPTSYVVPWLLGGRFPVIPVVHDLIAFRTEPHDRRATRIERWTLPRAARRARHILTVSETTKKDLLARFPKLPSSAVTPVFAGPQLPDAPRNASDHRTVLCVGTLSPRKNQRRLIEAYASLDPRLRERMRLVLAGARGWMDDDIVASAKSTPGVEWRAYVSDEEYRRLLGSCEVFALPSLYEGFGMQLLDALQRGVPVLTADRGSLREVCGDAAHYVDPENAASIAEGLDLLLRDDRMRHDLAERAVRRAALFSWKRTVDTFLEVIR